MSDQITTAFVQDYKSTVQGLLQQNDSRFRMAVSEDSYTGKAGKAVEQVGAVTAQKRTSRHADTPLIETPHDARWVYPVDYEWADLIDNQDKLRMIIDPTSPYAINGMKSMRRAFDDEIIDAFFGTAKTGDDGDTSTTFPAAQQVTSGSTGLTVAKLRAAKKLLMAAEVDLDSDPIYCAISAEQHDDLLGEVQTTNKDYTDRPVLVDGKITRFMGFDFIHSERLPTNGSSERRVPVWAKSGMHVGVWEDMMARVSERDDKSYSVQVYLAQTIGATRLEEGKVVEIPCAE